MKARDLKEGFLISASTILNGRVVKIEGLELTKTPIFENIITDTVTVEVSDSGKPLEISPRIFHADVEFEFNGGIWFLDEAYKLADGHAIYKNL